MYNVLDYYIHNSSYFCISYWKIAKKIAQCVYQTLSTITKLTHTSHLIADLSHTHAPPHLIKALRATIIWS